MNTTATIIIFAAALAVIGYLLYLRFLKPNDGIFRGKYLMKNKVVSPKGVTFYGYKKASAELMREVDRGLDTCFEIAERDYGYANFSRHERYTVFIYKTDDRCAHPAFMVDASGTIYDQSEWDKDPEPGKALVCAAGMQLLHENRPAMCIPDSVSNAHNAAWFEAEHNVLLEVDVAKYAATQYHAEGQGHPILPRKINGIADTGGPNFKCGGGRR